MDNMKLGVVEARFAELIWANQPIPSGELVRLCQTELNWKKSTTYTVLKKLCDRGIFTNQGGTVTALISKDDFYSIQSESFLNETFNGSLPAFIAAFSKRKPLTKDEIDAIRTMIDSYEED